MLLLLLILLQLSQLLLRAITLNGGHRVDRRRWCGHFQSACVQEGDVVISLDNNHDLQSRREVDEEKIISIKGSETHVKSVEQQIGQRSEDLMCGLASNLS